MQIHGKECVTVSKNLSQSVIPFKRKVIQIVKAIEDRLHKKKVFANYAQEESSL